MGKGGQVHGTPSNQLHLLTLGPMVDLKIKSFAPTTLHCLPNSSRTTYSNISIFLTTLTLTTIGAIKLISLYLAYRSRALTLLISKIRLIFYIKTLKRILFCIPVKPSECSSTSRSPDYRMGYAFTYALISLLPYLVFLALQRSSV